MIIIIIIIMMMMMMMMMMIAFAVNTGDSSVYAVLSVNSTDFYTFIG